MDLLPATSTPWTRLAVWVRGLFGRGIEKPEVFQAGGDYVPGQPAPQRFDPNRAMGAMSKFGWVYGTITRSAMDLSRVPIRASRGSRGGKAKGLGEHPYLTLLERPSPDVSGTLFRRQMIVDRRLTGNAYALKLYDSRGQVIGLRRLHPETTHAICGSGGQVLEYLYRHGGREDRYARSAIIHIRGPSWASGPAEVAGTGMIEPLNQDLNTDWALQKRTATAATQGRPAGIATPKSSDPNAKLNPEAIVVLQKILDKTLTNANGGIALLGQGIDFERLDYAPVELQSLETRAAIVKQILAVAGVPPVRVGIEAANFATAQQQGETYWGDELASEAQLFDEELTYHARLDFGPGNLYLWHDFSDVPALQNLRTAQVGRVSTHIVNGMDPANAYSYEGMDDAPIAAETSPTPAADAPVQDPAAQKDGLDWWDREQPARRAAPAVLVRGAPPHGGWNAWRSQLQAPAEAKLRTTMARLLREQRGRVLGRLDTMGNKSGLVELRRDLLGELVDLLLPSADDTAMRAGLQPALQRIVERAARWGAGRLDRQDPDLTRLDAVVEQQLGALIADVSETTKADIRHLVQTTLSGGGTIHDIQQQLQDFHSFAPTRALRVARTEATRSVSAGAVHAWRGIATDEGLTIRKGWMAKPSSRPAHQALDGLTAGVDEVFTVPSGSFAGRSAQAPGGFGVPGLDINCTCGLKPIVED